MPVPEIVMLPVLSKGQIHHSRGLDLFHSDHGSVYTSDQYRRLCVRFGVTQSMGAIGTSADNSLAESFNASLKREVL
ncbi:DDE-type integrase/transposase/recombinase [Corynebacterium qintianiae]|uniref:DDE-type integrase/transposase/recombinase n=1 Tax=Corynebacterium qintianiae TaxID=2709392 RepID=A0A7T0KPW1_9CORY|nr:DDE-type integrase/transposase/recombinase [Corynebacterium qintianiae]